MSNLRLRTLTLSALAVCNFAIEHNARCLKFISPILGEASGSLGGAVAAKARGGIQYFRKKVIPRNPSSLLQTAIRSAVGSASSIWKTELSETQIQAWWDLATGSQTGKSLFSQINQPRIYANNTGRVKTAASVDTTLVPAYFADPPAGSLTVPFFCDAAPVIDDSDNALQISAGAGDWNTGADATHKAAVFVYMSGPQVASRLSRQHPYQLVQCFAVTAATAPDFDAIDLADLGIPTVADHVAYVKIIAQDKDGRVSLPLEYRVTITA